jgi:hypothetical protein
MGLTNFNFLRMESIKELTPKELLEIEGGIFDNIWEAIGYIFTSHAREVMGTDNAPSVLAYK